MSVMIIDVYVKELMNVHIIQAVEVWYVIHIGLCDAQIIFRQEK